MHLLHVLVKYFFHSHEKKTSDMDGGGGDGGQEPSIQCQWYLGCSVDKKGVTLYEPMSHIAIDIYG